MRQSNLKQSIKNTIVSSRREKRLTPREEQETVAQFLARGGQIVVCPSITEGLEAIKKVNPKATIDKAIKKDRVWFIYYRLS